MLGSLRLGSTLRQRCLRTPIAGLRSPADWACQRRNFSSRFQKTKKARVEVLEKEYEAPNQSAIPHEQRGSYYEQQQQAGSAPSSTVFPSYAASREREREGSTYDNLSSGIVAHMQKVYGTLATGIGIAAGASLFAMATPIVTMHPLIPGVHGQEEGAAHAACTLT